MEVFMSNQDSDKKKRDSRIFDDPDFITLKRYSYSLEKLIARYPDGVPIALAAQALNLTVEEFKEKHSEAIKNIQNLLAF